jgi:murein L,D-transpeptidase YcbB/YkuD
MSGVRLDQLVILVAVVLVASGGAFGWSKSGFGETGKQGAPPRPSKFVQTADSRTSPSPSATSIESDEVPNSAFMSNKTSAKPHQAASTEGDEVPNPAAVAPPTSETSSAMPQPPASSAGDEVPAPAIARDAVRALPAKSSAGGGRDEAPTNPVTAPAQAATISPTAAPTPAITDANVAVADQLRGVLEGDKAKSALEAFYSVRKYAPLWITDGKINERAQVAISYLAHVDIDGLDPADYPVPDFTLLADSAALAEAEVKLSVAVTAYAHHAQVGRVHWTRVSGDIFYELKPSAPADVLANLAGANDVAAALAAYEPQMPAYMALKANLTELRAKMIASKAAIPNGPVLKVGMHDERVPLLRERLGVNGDGPIFDKALDEAIKKFQQENNLKPTGMLAAATLEALNSHQSRRAIDTVIANMERWRWMPHDLGSTYVMVNLTDFMLYVIQNGRQVWATKVVDGKPETPTPIMSAEMKSITVNPTWNIPDTIAAREYVPLMRQDSTILERMGLNVSYNRDNTIHISQPPGPNNALGQLRFNFPNKFFVYQHDSNEKYLFAKPVRDSSHGCMRVQDPVKYAEVLLEIARPREGFTKERIRGMFGNAEIEVRLPISIPVHVTYQTAFVDKEGKLQFREDIYGRDKALLAILKSDERKLADVPIERKDNVVRREALAMPDQAWGWSGQNFFARLFGSPAAQTGPRRRSVTERNR